MDTCPHCGRSIQIQITKDDSVYTPVYSRPWTPYQPMADSAKRFGDVAQSPAAEMPDLATRDTPVRGVSREDFVVPFWRTLVTGGLFGITIGGAIIKATPHNTFGNDLSLLGGSILMTTCASWVFFTFRADATQWMHERAENKKKEESQHVIIEASLYRENEEGDPGWDFGKWPAPSVERMREYARDLLDGHAKFSEKGSGKYGFSQDQFKQLKMKFITVGWAQWRNPDNTDAGAEVLAPGRAILKKIAEGRL